MPGTTASRPRPQRTREATRPVGHWNSFTENSATQNRTHSPANEILTAASEDVHHDAKGNTTLIPPALRPHSVPLSISWDFDNKLRAADTDNDSTDDVFYKRDALGRRIGRDDGTTNVVYFQDGQQTLADYTTGAAASSPAFTYVYGSYIDELLLRSGSNMHYYHRNQQYSIVALTDGGGSVAERYAYDAYGEPSFFDGSGVVQTGSANRYTYTGREWDAELSLYHYRARMYDALAGRFVSRDPIQFKGSPWNLYEYGYSGALSGTDPSGEAWWWILPVLPFLEGCSGPKQLTDEECCDAFKNAGHADKPGHVVCCQGRKISCVFSYGGDKTKVKNDPDARRHIASCVEEHEDRHHQDTQPCKPGNVIHEPNPTVSKDEGECHAYKVEQACLEKKKGYCKNPLCEQELQDTIDFVRSQKEYFCGRANISF